MLPTMKIMVKSGSVPAGTYSATFQGVENVNNDFGPGLRFNFRISGGLHDGRTVSRTTSPNAFPQNACGKMVAAISAKPIEVGTEVDLSTYVGKLYLIIVAATKSGASRVETVTPMPNQQ
jgi:hypothetical protein